LERAAGTDLDCMSGPHTVSQDDLFSQLRKVVEPCSILMGRPVDICAMGLVDQVDFIAGHVRVVLCLTDPGCIHFKGMKRYIADALLAIPGVSSVEVALTTQTLWTPDRIEAQGRFAKEPAATTASPPGLMAEASLGSFD
jgi:metal-sulfur cluster biosynthetic enzyme